MAELAALQSSVSAQTSAAPGTGCRIREIALAKTRIQAVPGKTFQPCLPGIDLPTQSNTVAGMEPQVYWLAPGDWLVCSARSSEALYTSIAGTIDRAQWVATDVSAALVALELSGPRVLPAIQSGCGLDLEGGALDGARCARTLLGQVTVLLAGTGSSDAWRVICERPVAAWLRDWLLNAAGEQGNMDA
jgi:heterotetrameric sarcosine oxidase gamma subunit